MFRPETHREKAARESPQIKLAVAPQPVAPVEAGPQLQAGESCWEDCIIGTVNVIRYSLYVICCCGCSTSYDDFQEHFS